jgi:hypothetical protein
MANMSNYLENKIIDQIFRGLPYSFPSTLYVALATATPTDATTGATVAEVTGGTYSRQAVVSTTANWFSTDGLTSGPSAGTNGTTTNVAAINFPAATADWGTVVGIVITDSGTTAAGNALFWGTLTSNKVVTNGDTFSFNSSNISVQIDN